MKMNPTTAAVRATLLAHGIRTVAFRFDGAGDSGSLDALALALDPSLPIDSDADFDDYFYTKYELQNNFPWKKVPPSTVAAHGAFEVIESESSFINTLERLGYDALEYFDGDWVNNDGGFGVVAIDLATGAFEIQGQQRYTETTEANSEGTLNWDSADVMPQTTAEAPLATQISTTLGLPTA